MRVVTTPKADSTLGAMVPLGSESPIRTQAEMSNDRVPIGKDEETGRNVSVSIPMIEHHVHVLGASGSGKSTFLSHLIGHHISNGLGLIFIDLKSDTETVSEIAARCEASGRLSELRLFDLSKPHVSLPYNPCRRGNATEIKDKIVGALDWESEYYKNKAQSYLLTVLRGMVHLRDKGGKVFTLEDLYQVTLGPSPLVALGLELEKSGADSRIVEDIEDLSRSIRSKEYQNELEGLRTQLKLLLNSEFGDCLMDVGSGIDFFDAIRNRQIVYFLLDSQKYGDSAKRLGKLILQDLKSCSGEIATRVPESERTHCTIVVDEFADLVTEQFVGLLNRARGSKLGIVIAHQEVADLDALSPAIRAQVMGNTSTTVSFLQKNAESAERVSSLAGTKSVVKQTRQMEEDRILFFKTQRPTGISSEREVEEFRIHPNRIKALKRGQCVIVGKYPEAWHAVVTVNPPEKWGADQGKVETHLEEFKEKFSQGRTEVKALGLRRKAREWEKITPASPPSKDAVNDQNF